MQKVSHNPLKATASLHAAGCMISRGPYHPLPAYAAKLARDLALATEQAVQSSQQCQVQGDVGSNAVARCPAAAAKGHSDCQHAPSTVRMPAG